MYRFLCEDLTVKDDPARRISAKKHRHRNEAVAAERNSIKITSKEHIKAASAGRKDLKVCGHVKNVGYTNSHVINVSMACRRWGAAAARLYRAGLARPLTCGEIEGGSLPFPTIWRCPLPPNRLHALFQGKSGTLALNLVDLLHSLCWPLTITEWGYKTISTAGN